MFSRSVCFILFLIGGATVQAQEVEIISLEPILFRLGITDREIDAVPLEDVADLHKVTAPTEDGAENKHRLREFPISKMAANSTATQFLLGFESSMKAKDIDLERDAALVAIKDGEAKLVRVMKGPEDKDQSLENLAWINDHLVRITYVGHPKKAGKGVKNPHEYSYGYTFYDLDTQRSFTLEDLLPTELKTKKTFLIRAFSPYFYMAHTAEGLVGLHFNTASRKLEKIGSISSSELKDIDPASVIHMVNDEDGILYNKEDGCRIKVNPKGNIHLMIRLTPTNMTWETITETLNKLKKWNAYFVGDSDLFYTGDEHSVSIGTLSDGARKFRETQKWQYPLEINGSLTQTPHGFVAEAVHHPQSFRYILRTDGSVRLLINRQLEKQQICRDILTGVAERPHPDLGVGIYRVRL